MNDGRGLGAPDPNASGNGPGGSWVQPSLFGDHGESATAEEVVLPDVVYDRIEMIWWDWG